MKGLSVSRPKEAGVWLFVMALGHHAKGRADDSVGHIKLLPGSLVTMATVSTVQGSAGTTHPHQGPSPHGETEARR